MATVYGDYRYFDSGNGWWRTRVDYNSSNSGDVYIEVKSGYTVWVRLTGKLDGTSLGSLSYSSSATSTHLIATIYLGSTSSSHTVSLECTGGTWGQDGTSTATVPAQVVITTPTLSNVSISSVGRTSANASFSVTNTGGASIVDNYIDCGTYNFGNVVSTISSTSGTFTGLTPNTTYYARANASNGTYRGYSSVASFTTTHNNPSIGHRSVTHTAQTTAINSLYDTVISYSTTYDYASYSSHSLVYGITTSYGSSATSQGTGGSSAFKLSNLKPNTTYYYKITETDNTNQTSTTTGSFTTPSRVKVVYPDGTVKAAKVKIIQ